MIFKTEASWVLEKCRVGGGSSRLLAGIGYPLGPNGKFKGFKDEDDFDSVDPIPHPWECERVTVAEKPRGFSGDGVS